ncbi:type II toxin-antitoxin system prevent-host-death family antitoxin [Fontimonas sp. SYSU GA230001]|uniref:type II toxin-antitoxin system Phd/YefM family antitoxin n=1 Tax=Fontimonas sp. SYSU GA230001 TaxID=3142450 RepID=UPI0032B34E50
MEVGAYEAKTHLPKLLARVARGERITITKHGKAVAELRPVQAGGSHEQVERAWRRLEELRANRPKGRKPITVAEIIAARDEGRR